MTVAHADRIRLLAAAALLAAGAVQAQVPPNPYSYSRTSSFTYNTAAAGAKNGLLATETVEPGNPQICTVTTYQYDAYGNKTSANSANCNGATGRALFTPRATTSSFAGTSNQPITVNGATQFVNVPDGMYASTITNAILQSETRTYDPRFGAVLSLTGPNQLTTNWSVDDFGRRVLERRADGTSTLTFHCVLTGTNPDGSVRDLTSNSPGCYNGSAPVMVAPAGTEAPADAFMVVHSEPRDTNNSKMGPFVRVYTDRLGREIRTVTESFDGAGQPAGRSGALLAKDTVYSSFGAKIFETQPYFLASGSSTTAGTNDQGVTRSDVDLLGRPIAIYVADPNGSQSNIDFGAYGTRTAAKQTIAYAGLTTTTTNDKNQTRIEEKNAVGEVFRVTDASGAQLVLQRDAFGNLVATRDALQNTISTTYDIRGRKVSMTDPDAGLWQYDYDALGELVYQQNANQRARGTSTTLTYDVLGRMTSRADPEYTSTWTYDKYADGSACNKGAGKLCEVNATGSGLNRKLVYDNVGRPINSRTSATINNGYAAATALAYDPVTGRVASQTYPTGLQVSYGYTSRGFLEKLTLATAATVNPLPATVGGTPGPSANLAAGTVLWQGQSVNAWGRTERQQLANGVVDQAVYEAATGRLTNATAGAGGTATVLNHSYTWDSLNNLTVRTDANGDGLTGPVTETFTYADNLDRLTAYSVSGAGLAAGSRTVTLQYNALGLLLYKSDVGNYSYPTQGAGAVRPHALQSVAAGTASSYAYDGNGNVTSASGSRYASVSYTSFNLPDGSSGLQGPLGFPRYQWQYDENHARLSEVRTLGSGTGAGSRTTWYLHPDNAGGLGFETEINSPATPSPDNPAVTSQRHFLTIGGQPIGVLVSTGSLPALAPNQTAPAPLVSITLVKVEFWHRDHLGSVAATTDHSGAVTQRYGFDPFGQRRFAAGTTDSTGNLVVDWSPAVNWGTGRGYTGHEHLDDAGLVHMNGRLYDPRLGLFLQADPLLQEPLNLQSFHRYGYCLANPLTCTDPSGYDFGFFEVLAVVAAIWGAERAGLIDVRTARLLTSLAVGAALSPASGVQFFDGGLAQAATAGFASGAIASGNLKGAVQGAFTAGLFYGAGSLADAAMGEDPTRFANPDRIAEASANTFPAYASGGVARVALHGIVGCVSGAVGGGKCGPGALSAAFSEAATPYTKSAGVLGGTAASAVIGGTGSVLGGGKFANGAMTGAFGYLFNRCAHEGCWTTSEERAFLKRGDFLGYYSKACEGSDLNACFFYGVASGQRPGPSDTLLRGLLDQGYSFTEASKLVQSTIPLNLANDYANLLPQSEAQRAFPNAQDIAQYHWDEFAKYGLPPSAFGGTPFGKSFGLVMPRLWCPLCQKP